MEVKAGTEATNEPEPGLETRLSNNRGRSNGSSTRGRPGGRDDSRAGGLARAEA